MADIFVSYAHVDDGSVRAIVGELEQQGFSVWWDIALRSGQNYGDVIEHELGEAKCVLAVWSRASRNSSWVKAESSFANDAGKLVQVVLQSDVRPPLPFNIIHFEPIARGPRADDANWRDLIDAIRARVGGAAGERAPPRTPNPVNSAAILSTLSALGLGAYIAALNVPAVAAVLQLAPAVFGDPIALPLYAALVLGAGSALLTLSKIAAVASAGR
jgi:hypothetical protein